VFYADNYCTYEEEHTSEGDFYVFTGPCKKTGQPYSVRVPAKALYKYRQGASIQDAMPMLSRDDREFLMSGYSPEGWNQVFADDEKEEDTEEEEEFEET
jgi:hypothetical protein